LVHKKVFSAQYGFIYGHNFIQGFFFKDDIAAGQAFDFPDVF